MSLQGTEYCGLPFVLKIKGVSKGINSLCFAYCTPLLYLGRFFHFQVSRYFRRIPDNDIYIIFNCLHNIVVINKRLFKKYDYYEMFILCHAL